jgi:hypothetical protein
VTLPGLPKKHKNVFHVEPDRRTVRLVIPHNAAADAPFLGRPMLSEAAAPNATVSPPCSSYPSVLDAVIVVTVAAGHRAIMPLAINVVMPVYRPMMVLGRIYRAIRHRLGAGFCRTCYRKAGS